MMITQKVLEQIVSGDLKLELHNHKVGHQGTVEHLKELLESWVSLEAGSNDGKWSVHKDDAGKDVNKDMREYYTSKLKRAVLAKDGYCLAPFDIKAQCHCCSEHLHWVLNEEEKQVELAATFSSKAKGGFVVKPVGERNCALNGIKSLKGSIEVNSKLIFANFFRTPDSTKADEYQDNWSLSTLLGRKNITEFKAKTNVAYGQMGNMSVAVYYSKDRQEILIASNTALEGGYMEDAVKEKKLIASRKEQLKGFKKLGEISLEMWRWEATDLNTLTQEKLDKMKAEKYPQDIVEIEVEHGTWEFEQFYGVRELKKGEDGWIYARLGRV